MKLPSLNKLATPSFDKHNPAPAFLLRAAPAPKPEPVIEPSRRFTADERHIIAKALASEVLHDMEIAKAARRDDLAKRAAARAESDIIVKAALAKADTMLRTCEQLSAQLTKMEADIERIEAWDAAFRRASEMRGMLPQ